MSRRIANPVPPSSSISLTTSWIVTGQRGSVTSLLRAAMTVVVPARAR